MSEDTRYLFGFIADVTITIIMSMLALAAIIGVGLGVGALCFELWKLAQ